MERTLVILKPDCIARRLAGKIITRFEEKGLRIAAMRMEVMKVETAEKHYAEHKAKPFFDKLTAFITSGPIIIMAIEGVDVVKVVRKMLGATLGRAAEPGSIRGDFGMSQSFNLVHASDSLESAQRELALYFEAKDFIPAPSEENVKWVYDFSEGGPN
ncbi:MAG: nucleoside-diphosphate kinase [Planctomycetes bacterium]|nr:nucleoside-diphosphate kinase [Planctomycetota bacterium]